MSIKVEQIVAKIKGRLTVGLETGIGEPGLKAFVNRFK
jgi:hypothetical protein